MTTDNRPTPPERIYVAQSSVGNTHLIASFLTHLDESDLTYRLSDPADPLVRLSDVERAVSNLFPYTPVMTFDDMKAVLGALRLTAERGDVSGDSSGEGK